MKKRIGLMKPSSANILKQAHNIKMIVMPHIPNRHKKNTMKSLKIILLNTTPKKE